MKPVGVGDLVLFFFYAGGRISRQEYTLGTVFIYALNAVLFAFAFHQAESNLALGFAIMVSAFPSTVASLVLAAKRCHDIALPGAAALLLLVPLVGVLWLIALAAVDGTPNSNLYGPRPRFEPN